MRFGCGKRRVTRHEKEPHGSFFVAYYSIVMRKLAERSESGFRRRVRSTRLVHVSEANRRFPVGSQIYQKSLQLSLQIS